MTAFYMFRLIYLTFWSPSRVMSHEVEHHIHESPKSMTWPLVILALFRFSPDFWAGLTAWVDPKRFDKFLDPVFAHGEARVLSEQGEAGQVAAGKRKKSTPVRQNIC